MTRIYRNPNAASYTSQAGALPDPQVLRFHQQLPEYSPTPLRHLTGGDIPACHIYVKDESSRLGLPAFKILGASWAAYRALSKHLSMTLDFHDDTLERLKGLLNGRGTTLFAATDGNHGRAVARMAALLAVQSEIHVPAQMDETTRTFIKGEGARLVVSTGDYDDAVRDAYLAAQASKDGVLVQDTAFEGYEEVAQWIVDGYIKMFHELDEQLEALTSGRRADVVIVPVGVGSLAQAAIAHFKRPGRAGKTVVVTVEPDTAACVKQALLSRSSSGTPQSIRTSNTIMAGLNCGTVSTIAWPLIRDGVDVAVSVSDIEAHQAVQTLRDENIAIGPCGAAPLAALRQLALHAPDILDPDKVVVLLATEGEREYATPLDSTVSDAVSLTQMLVRIDSSNPDLSEGAGETAIADYLSAWLQHHDFEVHRLESCPGRPSIVGVLRGSGGGKTLMFNGHVDTVTLASYAGDALSGQLADGKVYGRGALDMKAGVASCLVASLRARESGQLKGDIVVALVADEENLSIGTQEVLAAGWTADAAIVSEPTGCAMILAHKGFVWFEVDILGRAGHGSRPDLCVDAIVKSGHFLVALDMHGAALAQGAVSNAVSHAVLGTGSVHAGVIKGGEEVSSYPAICTISLERRTVPGETPDSVEEELRVILDGLVQLVSDFKYVLRRGESREPYEMDEQHSFVQLVAHHGQAVTGASLPIDPGTYWTDCALLAEQGIPALLFGPKGEGLHAAEEWVTTESIELVVNVLTRVAIEFCS